MSNNIVDARGLSCPQPVLMTKNALLSKEDRYEVIVDNGTARENVTRFAQHAGYQVSCTEQNGDYHLSLTR